MAYAKEAADRVRAALGRRAGLTEKEMFGGVGFLLHGNLCVGVHGEDLIVRVAPADTDALLRERGAKPFNLSGRRGGTGMAGWLLVAPPGYRADVSLRAWVARGVDFASSLPPKRAGKAKGKR